MSCRWSLWENAAARRRWFCETTQCDLLEAMLRGRLLWGQAGYESRESDLLPFTYTPLWLVDDLVVYLKRERPLNNQLQPLTSKTDKKLLEVFLQMPIRAAKTGAHSRSEDSVFAVSISRHIDKSGAVMAWRCLILHEDNIPAITSTTPFAALWTCRLQFYSNHCCPARAADERFCR